MIQRRAIYHFEDQGNQFQFLPEALHTHFWLRFPAWDRPKISALKDNGTFLEASVEIFPPKRPPVVIAYKLFSTKDLFLQHCVPEEFDVVLIDVMKQQGSNEFTADGLEMFNKKLSLAPRVTVWVVTGYERKFKDWVERNQLPNYASQAMYDWLFVKPIDSVAFINRLVEKLGIV